MRHSIFFPHPIFSRVKRSSSLLRLAGRTTLTRRLALKRDLISDQYISFLFPFFTARNESWHISLFLFKERNGRALGKKWAEQPTGRASEAFILSFLFLTLWDLMLGLNGIAPTVFPSHHLTLKHIR